ncbi:MAG: PAS domain S-box protein, partial [Actinomycetes bacterium]
FDGELASRRDALARVAEIVPLDALRDPTLIQRWLDDRKGMASLFPDGLSVVAADGTVLADSPADGSRQGSNVTTRDWFRQAQATRRPLIAEPYIGGATGRPVLVTAAPLGKGPDFIGVLAAVTYLDQENIFVNAFKTDASTNEGKRELFVVSKKSGSYIASRDPKQIMATGARAGRSPQEDRYMSGFEGHGISTSPGGVEILSASKNMATVPWHVVVQTETSVALKIINHILSELAVWGLGICVLTGTIVWFVVTHFLRPIERASRIIEREFDSSSQSTEPIPLGGNDEIGILLRGFSRSQERLRERTRELNIILENSSVGIVLVKHRAMVWVNDRMGELFGCPSAELVGKSSRILYPKGEAYEVLGKVGYAAMSRGERYVSEQEMQHADGSRVWMRLTGKAIDVRLPGEGSIWVLEDITEQKRLHSELDEHRRQLSRLVEQRTAEVLATEATAQLILDSSADGLLGTDLDGRATFINPAGCAMLGYRADQIVGTIFHDLVHHRRADGTPYPSNECPSFHAMTNGKPARVDNEVYWHADGRAIPVMYATLPIV